MKFSDDYGKQVAQQIIDSLGGARDLYATGTKVKYYDHKDNNDVKVMFQLSRNKSGAKYLEITSVYSSDLFTIEFFGMRRKTFERIVKSKVTGYYAEMVIPHFEEITGLITKPF